MPAAETFLTAVLIIAAAGGAVAWFGRPLWRKLGTAVRSWQEADAERERVEAALRKERAEQDARLAQLRAEAEQEVTLWAGSRQSGDPATEGVGDQGGSKCDPN